MRYTSLFIILVLAFSTQGCKKKERQLECDKGYEEAGVSYTPPVEFSSMHLSRSDAAVIRSDSDFYSVFLDTTIVVNVDWTKNSLIGTSVYTPYEVKIQGSSLCVNHDKEEYILSVYLTTREREPEPNTINAWYVVPVVPSSYVVTYTKSVD